ncbi:unnamed protein product [Schistosoma curassoni]|nr:unnamed protein product [Schistosoma curassoni]
MGPPSLKTSGANPSEPAAPPRFRLTIVFRTSARVGGPTSMFHSGCLGMVGSCGVAEVQLKCSLKCSTHRSKRLDWEQMRVSSFSEIV